MTEEFLHYVWKLRLFTNKTIDNEIFEVVSIGEHNHDAGPDFFNAKIKIGNTVWAGNVEIHVNSSDWHKHNHDIDAAYDNVILQLVNKNDATVTRTNGSDIPTLVLEYPETLFMNYSQLLENSKQLWISCENDLQKVDSFVISFWLNQLLVERLESKANQIQIVLEQNQNNWEETFYQLLARNFGFKTNALPFEMLAKSLPINYLAKHKNSLLQLEALLFGQAGFLNEASDEYSQSLQKEYQFLQQKFNLIPLEKHLWKFARMRPYNFPTVRIAQFAALIHHSSALFSKTLGSNEIKQIYSLFQIKPSEYWLQHFNFGKTSIASDKHITDDIINNLIINTLIPFLFVYGTRKGDESYKQKALNFLEELPAESNSLISNWQKIGVNCNNAYDSQALLQLKNEYCAKNRCIHCQIGSKLIQIQNESAK